MAFIVLERNRQAVPIINTITLIWVITIILQAIALTDEEV